MERAVSRRHLNMNQGNGAGAKGQLIVELMHEIKFNRRYRSVINRQKQAMKNRQLEEASANKRGNILKIADVLTSRKLNATIKGAHEAHKEDHSHFLNKMDMETQLTDKDALIEDLVECFPPQSRFGNKKLNEQRQSNDAANAMNLEKISR
jgi:hypothetical protein